MDLGTLLLLGFMWLVFNAIRKAGRKPPGSPRSTPQPPPGGSARPGPRPATQVRLRTGTGLDATQREGSRLDELLRELGRTLDQVSGPAGRAPDRAPDRAPVVRSLETDPGRPERILVDQDDEAEQVIARRLAAAEAYLQPRTQADHQAFDARIRQEPADKTVTPAYTARQLRDAVVWREILGPPVSLRGEEER